MGFAIKVIDERFGLDRWVAPHTAGGPHRMRGKDEAQVFPTYEAAESEVKVLQQLFGDRFRFEIESR